MHDGENYYGIAFDDVEDAVREAPKDDASNWPMELGKGLWLSLD